MIKKLLILTILLPQLLWAEPVNFSKAKKILPDIYSGMEQTIYCGCSYSGQKPDLKSCGYKVRKESKRANRVEWEHIVPSEHSGRSRACWHSREQFPECRKSNGELIYGRKCCNKVDPEFRKLSGNLHNLAPAIGEMNGNRSNYRFAQLPFDAYQYGQCQAKVDFKARKFEPRDEVKGDVARVNFYFASKGYIKLSKSQRQLFNAWNKQDPVDEYECTIHAKKAKLQGEENAFVADGC